MEVFWGLQRFGPAGNVHLAHGMFDGVHRGHQALIGTARRAAADETSGRCVVLTFDPHPRSVIDPGIGPILLTTVDERLEYFAGLGVDAAVVVRFDAQVRDVRAPEWAAAVAAAIGPRVIYASAGHRFGRDGEGTVDLLARFGTQHGFSVVVVPPLVLGGMPVSSSGIREMVRDGRMVEAAVWLGRPYRVAGTVVTGERRGRILGFPTANLEVPPDKVLPARGAYAGWAVLSGERRPAALSVGTQPTFGGGRTVVEAHLLDFTGDLYGERLELLFAERLHEDIAFSSAEALVAQIAADVAATRAFLTRVAAEAWPLA